MFHVVVLVLTIFLSNGDHKTLAIDDLPIRGDAPAQIGNDVCVCVSFGKEAQAKFPVGLKVGTTDEGKDVTVTDVEFACVSQFPARHI
jgi:hypothetical protein